MASTSHAIIQGVDYYFPEGRLTNSQLALDNPEWTVEKIEQKTGIVERPIAGEDEAASDLGVEACRKLFAQKGINPADIDFLLLCTQTPDYLLPTTACVMQHRLGLRKEIGALDFNLGCSGYIYGLGLAKGLIETGQAKNVLLVTADTYSKLIHPGDRSVRTLFGDAASATLVSGGGAGESIGSFAYGTDGSGSEHLIVPVGGARRPSSASDPLELITDKHGNTRTSRNLYMNGPEIFNFSIREVPKIVERTLASAQIAKEDIDLFVFHQANAYMLEHLRKRMAVDPAKFYVCVKHCGNTVSSTIPVALAHAAADGTLRSGMRLMLVGFGVGFSWGACVVHWR